jgi:DNA repair exonuclease SbcCD ATPase subunit
MEAPQLQRGVFDYRSRSVRLVLADHDRLLGEASERARAAEARVLELRSEAERLKTQLAEHAEQLRALEAEAAELTTDRDAARRDHEGAVADAARLQLELTATRRKLETVRHDPGTTQHEIETGRGEPDPQDERLRAAEEGSGEIVALRRELISARRQFLIQGQQARSAEARIEDRLEELEAEVRSVRAELQARPAPDPSAAAEGTSAVPEAAGGTMVRIMDGAGTHAAEGLREEERARRKTLAEIERLEARRDRLAPLVAVVRSTIEDARKRAAGIGDRVDEAVAPLTEASAELSDRLAAFAELAALPGEDSREPASERSLNPTELEEQEGTPGELDPAGGVGAGTSHEPRTEEASGPAAEGIVLPAGPPPVDQAHRLDAEGP